MNISQLEFSMSSQIKENAATQHAPRIDYTKIMYNANCLNAYSQKCYILLDAIKLSALRPDHRVRIQGESTFQCAIAHHSNCSIRKSLSGQTVGLASMARSMLFYGYKWRYIAAAEH